MFINFDKKTMSIQILCGPTESYQPTENIEKIHVKTKQLQALLKQFQDKHVFPALQEIEVLVKEENIKLNPQLAPQNELEQK